MRAAAAMVAGAFILASPARSQMAHPPGMTHAQVVSAASAGAPASVSRNAAISWIDSAGSMHEMRAGTNGFTCFIAVPDPFGGPICGDPVATAWFGALLTGQSGPPAASAPGVAYMARGGVHYEDAKRNVLMEHNLSKHAAGTRRVLERAHWMLMYPFDSAATGLPTRENGTGSYIMFTGTPWAHLMIYQDPRKMNVR